MRSTAANMWISLTLAFALVLSALVTPLAAHAELPAEGAHVTTQAAPNAHGHGVAGPGSCHKTAACELPADLQPGHPVLPRAAAQDLPVDRDQPCPASTPQDMHLPPPKA